MTASRAVPELFAVDVRSIEGETVLRLHGELDISTQQAFVTAFAAHKSEVTEGSKVPAGR